MNEYLIEWLHPYHRLRARREQRPSMHEIFVKRGALQSGEPGSVYKGFVQRCLRERGYDAIGWK